MKTNDNDLLEVCIIFDFFVNYFDNLLYLKIPLISKMLSIIQHFLNKLES